MAAKTLRIVSWRKRKPLASAATSGAFWPPIKTEKRQPQRIGCRFSHYARNDTEAPVLSRPVGENLVRRYALKNSTSEGGTRLGPPGRIDGGRMVPHG